ncbi:MAG: Hsp20/alpha crystallin family protein [Deltaproteobacteria bacterium]|nr:Hsp20/alpha crystallin family protein [Deltaproteobacteria bacterium]
MALVKWDPFREATTLQERINRLFEDAFPRARDREEDLNLGTWRPAVDIYEGETGVVLKAELPGVKKEDVSVEVKDNVLTIKGERKVDSEVKEKNYYRRERTHGSFSRSFNLQYAVNPDKIKARFKDGVLEIEVPKPEEEKTKQINVNID